VIKIEQVLDKYQPWQNAYTNDPISVKNYINKHRTIPVIKNWASLSTIERGQAIGDIVRQTSAGAIFEFQSQAITI